jgi:hypothetical protein
MAQKAAMALLLAASTLCAGKWDVGGKVSVVQEGDKSRLKMVATAQYQMAVMLSWRTDLEMTFRDLGTNGEFDLSVPTNLLWYTLAHEQPLDPYIGPGAVLTRTWDGGTFFGLNALAGVNFRTVSGTTFGIEAKYTVVDITDWSRSDNFDVGMTGSWEVEF